MSTIWEDATHEGSAIRRRIGFDPATKKIVTEAYQPGFDEIVKVNRSLLNADRDSSSLWGGSNYVRVASIPLWLVEQWKIKEGIDFMNPDDYPKIVAKLNSSEYSDLRVAPGAI